MILDILLGLSLAAVFALLRACYLWGVAKGELREYRRTPEESFWRALERDKIADKIVRCSVPRPKATGELEEHKRHR